MLGDGNKLEGAPHQVSVALAADQVRSNPFSFHYHHHWVEGLHSPLAFTLRNMRLSNDPSVFDIVNYFRLRWFLNRDWLLSFIASAQHSKSGRIEWVEFLPNGHVHLVRSAFKLVPPSPSIPAAKIKRCMFSFIIEFLNQERLIADFFVPPPLRKARKRTRKPRDTGPQPPAGGQAVDAMALDTEDQDPSLEAPPSLQLPLELVQGMSSGTSTTSASAVVKRNPPGLVDALMEPSFVTAASPPPSHPPSLSAFAPVLRTYVEPAGRSIGLFHSVTPLAGTKHSLTPSPPSLPPSNLPTSPPPPVGTHLWDAPEDWRAWIQARKFRKGKGKVTSENLETAAQALAPPFPPPPL